MQIYSLDPAQYFTTPGLSWEVMLKTTNIQLELLTDIDMYRFIQNSIRMGLVQCCHRYTKANYKYLSDYIFLKGSSFLMLWMRITCMVGQRHNIYHINPLSVCLPRT